MSEPGGATVRPADEVPAKEIAAGKETVMRVLVGPEQGKTGFVTRKFTMGAGGGMPLHTNLVEHQQYVLRGRARLQLGDTTREVKADDTLFIPAGLPHSYTVLEAPFEFLCVVPDAPDKVSLCQTD